jgi:DNA-directed RNA polymerase subunit H (RpoH/RPB5)
MSRQNVIDIMRMQGYNVNDYADFSINEVSIMRTNDQLDMLLNRDTDGKKIWVRYYLNKVLKPQDLEEMIEDLFYVEEMLTKEDILFIIVKSEPNETLVEKLKLLWKKDGIFIIIINLKRLQFNILKHELVPPHRIMSIDEVIAIKLKYNITKDTEFPVINRFDPVAQVIGIRPGEVCEIIRPSKTAIEAPYYRICV